MSSGVYQNQDKKRKKHKGEQKTKHSVAPRSQRGRFGSRVGISYQSNPSSGGDT